MRGQNRHNIGHYFKKNFCFVLLFFDNLDNIISGPQRTVENNKKAVHDTFTRDYTLTGHFIRYTLLVPGWSPFCLQNCLNSSWHRFNKVLETFLRYFGPY